MYYENNFLAEVHLKKGETKKVVLLPDLVPIGRIWRDEQESKVSISDDGLEFYTIENEGGNRTAQYLKVESSGECRVKFFVGAGYWASRDIRYTETFLKNRENGWAGGDGINSFNLTNGNDACDAKCKDTLFIFGDTLVGTVDENNVRVDPVEMPNNTYALMNGDLEKIDFIVPRDDQKNIKAILAPREDSISEDTWFWLQDGVVIGDKLYLSPLIMKSDDDKPEGFQFQIADVCIVEIPVANGKPIFIQAKQREARLYKRKGEKQYVGGIAYLPYHEDMGYPDGDGYVYAYGYISSLTDENGKPELIVGRIRPKDFVDADKWKYYNGYEFVLGIENAVSILNHISCEMSVMPVVAGKNKGKFLAVFQYDGQSAYVGYSIGETPWGPFDEPCKVYECDEEERINETIYTYNAKAHSHLSSPSSILVTYNVNTPSMEENYRTADIYHPRFIRLHDTTIQEGIR